MLNIQKKTIKLFVNFKIQNVIVTITRFKNFIFYDIPSSLLSVSSIQLPNYFFNLIYTSFFAGQYFFIQRLLQAPVTIISGSILEVYKNEALNEIKQTGVFKKTFKKTFKTILIIIIFPLILGVFFIEDFIIFFYGENWITSAKIAKILLPVLALRLISNPLSFSIYLKEKQLINLVIYSILIFILIYIFFLNLESIVVVKIISLLFSFFYIFYIIYGYYLSNKK